MDSELKKNRSEEQTSKEDTSEILRDCFAKVILSTFFALIVFSSGYLNWWFGLILFIILLILHIIPALLLSGFFVFLMTSIFGISIKILKNRNIKMSAEILEEFKDNMLIGLINGIYCVYLLLLTSLLLSLFIYDVF